MSSMPPPPPASAKPSAKPVQAPSDATVKTTADLLQALRGAFADVPKICFYCLNGTCIPDKQTGSHLHFNSQQEKIDVLNICTLIHEKTGATVPGWPELDASVRNEIAAAGGLTVKPPGSQSPGRGRKCFQTGSSSDYRDKSPGRGRRDHSPGRGRTPASK